MTRATLLQVLDRPTALGPGEVRELEQLAQAFPYCQTAHLLLAKAAHDHGTMLAGQRLRRAATYAADRALLRRLIEQVEPAAAPDDALFPAETPAEVPAGAPPAPAAPAELPVAAPGPQASLPVETAESPHAPAPLPAAPEMAEQAPGVADTEPTEALPVSAVPAPPAVTEMPLAAPQLAAQEAAQPSEAAGSPAAGSGTGGGEVPVPVQAGGDASLSAEVVPAQAVAEAAEAAAAAENEPEGSEVVETALPAAPPSEEEKELPAQAPAIRPPAEVGAARFEFGLAEAPDPAVSAYELPGLIDEWADASVTLGLANPDLLAAPAVAGTAAAEPVFTPAAFTGDAAVGYGFGEGSRQGLALQLLDLLAAQAETAETHTPVMAAAQPATVPLPPAGMCFEPDPLLLDHWATHQPPAPALPSSLDLINNFLKRQPRLTRPAMLPPAPGSQTDLSARSTRAEPDLVSENLARIYIRQGKNARAIEIYEKLMVKHPEKMAYFAAQIHLLQPPV